MKRQVSLNNNSFDRAGITKDCQEAVCEYIWNGFEAGASKIHVDLQGAPLSEAFSITISDNGEGISFDNLDNTFGAFLSSIKNDSTIRIKSQTNKGKGRFSYLSFSYSAQWKTVYRSNGELKSYFISMNSTNKSSFDTTEPITETRLKETGTVVTFPLEDENTRSQLSFQNMKQKLLEEFSWYLFLNRDKNFSLEYMGELLDYSEYINTSLSRSHVETIDDKTYKIDLVVWNSSVANTSKIYYLSENGEVLWTENTSFNKNKVEFYHAVSVASKYFEPTMFLRQGEENDLLDTDESEKQRSIFRQLRKTISQMVSSVLKEFLVVKADKQLADMEERGSYPTFPDDDYGQLRKRDFENVTRELYCVEPKIFYRLNDTQEKSLLGFLNLLLSSEERENVLQIVDEVVRLTPEERRDFAGILKQTKLQYIIGAINIIEKRIAVVSELKKIVFDYSSFANERDHIQKIIEQHFWLFGEQYNMLTSDKNLKTSLQAYEKIADQSALPIDKMSIASNEALQRIDIFLYSQRIQEDSSSEMLIVELKAPHIRLTSEVFNQIVRYANTIRKEPRFTSVNRTWRYFAICSEIDDDVKVKYKNFEHYGKKGLADVIDNFELYALSWDDVFQSFEARHSFLLEKLKLDYSQVAKELGICSTSPKAKIDITNLTQELVSMEAR